MSSKSHAAMRRARKAHRCPKHDAVVGKSALWFRCGCPTPTGEKVGA